MHHQRSLTDRWLRSCYLAFNSSGYMYEKYNAFEVGVDGGGGEYVPQVGFGWSNAVALILLQQLYPAYASVLSSTGAANTIAAAAASSGGSIDEIGYDTLLYIVIAVVISMTLTCIIGIGIVYYLYNNAELRGANGSTELVKKSEEHYRLLIDEEDDHEQQLLNHHVAGSFSEQDEPAVLERVLRNSSFSRATVGLDPFDEMRGRHSETSKNR